MQHRYRPQPKPSSVQSAVGSALQESDSTATNEHAKTDHHLSQILVCEELAIIMRLCCVDVSHEVTSSCVGI